MLTVDKFTIIQNALSMTGNNVVAEADDGTDEWNVASRAFDRALTNITARHDWNFATRTALLESELTANPSVKYSRAFQPPTDCLQVISVWAPLPVDAEDFDSNLAPEQAYPITDYEIVAGKICTSRVDPLTLKYLTLPEPEDSHALFVEVITLYVEAGCLKGLNKDFGTALAREQQAELMLNQARPRVDMQTPRRNLRVSGLVQSRKVRRG